jgi:hypothetical protein
MYDLFSWAVVSLATLGLGAACYLVSWVLNWISYTYLKGKIIRRRIWDLNICCGRTDGGGVNADIIKHTDVSNFVVVKNIYRLPFRDGEFDSILCSHTIEHVDDPWSFDRELRRVGTQITYILPPLWDITAAFNVLEHKWLFLTFRTEHTKLPRFVRLPLASSLQASIGQLKKA